MNAFILTFGQKYRRFPHPAHRWIHPDGWVTIIADNTETARRLANACFGPAWAAIYPADEFSRDLFPLGEVAVVTQNFPISTNHPNACTLSRLQKSPA